MDLDPHDITASLIRALVLYALAEFQAGHATTIRVNADGHSFSVADDGRGHALERTVAGLPYLKFVYTHLDYPFEQRANAPVQLHAIGISLINALCSEVTVTTRKADEMLRMSFQRGRLCDTEVVRIKSAETGNTISAKLNPQLQDDGVDTRRLRQWLVDLRTASPKLNLYFNNIELHAAHAAGAGDHGHHSVPDAR